MELQTPSDPKPDFFGDFRQESFRPHAGTLRFSAFAHVPIENANGVYEEIPVGLTLGYLFVGPGPISLLEASPWNYE